MNELVTQIGVPAIVVILILREIVPAVRNGKSTKPNGFIGRPEFDKHKDAVQYKDNCEQIVKRMDGRFDTVDSSLKEVKEILRDR